MNGSPTEKNKPAIMGSIIFLPFLFLFFILVLITGCLKPIPAPIQECYKNGYLMEDCVLDVALKEKNIKYCDYIEADTSNLCYQLYFEKSNSQTIYEWCKTTQDVNACMQYFYSIKNDPAICQKLWNPFHDKCIAYYETK